MNRVKMTDSRRRTARDKDAGNGLWKRRAGRLRLILWAAVLLIQLLVLQAVEVKAAEEGDGEAGPDLPRIRVTSEIFGREEDCLPPDEIYADSDGTEYPLLSWEKEQVRVPAHSGRVEKTVDYEQVEGAVSLPEILEITVRESGQQAAAQCRLAESRVTEEWWQDGFTFPVTFHRYDAGFFQLGDQLISGSEERPRLEGKEGLLLAELGLQPEEYRIQEILWDGEPYEAEDGSICRDAIAYGQKLLRNYQARYEGTAWFPDHEGWQTAALYGPPEENIPPAASESQVTILPSPPSENPSPPPPPLWQKITRTILTTLALGLLLFFLALLLLIIQKLAKSREM